MTPSRATSTKSHGQHQADEHVRNDESHEEEDDCCDGFENLHTALAESPHIGRQNLRSEARQGRVTLRGIVNTYYQKQMAQEAVRHLEGVEEIENQLQVSWGSN